MNGISFKKIEINFTYSFLWRFDNFNELVKKLEDISTEPMEVSSHYPPSCDKKNNAYLSCQHNFIKINKVYDVWNKKDKTDVLENNVFHWSIGTHPDRLGLAPLMHFDTPENQSTSRDVTEVSCYFRKSGPIEIRSGVDDSEFINPIEKTIVLQLDSWEILVRVSDNGEGVATFKFILDFETCSTPKWDKEKSNYQRKMTEKIGVMPFIFSVLTLGRTEHYSRQSNAPVSRLRNHENDDDDFESLYEIFHKILYHTILKKLCPSALFKASSEAQDKANDITSIESMDLHVMSPNLDAQAYHPEMWQSPYVSMFATLIEKDTLIEINEGCLRPWWFKGLKDLRACNHQRADENMKGQLNLVRCYKESVLLLLRLYQWREFLDIDNFSIDKEYGTNSGIDNVPIPPDLMKYTVDEYVFSDVDLVWDARYLMLYHERSTLVLTTVKNEESGDSFGSFKTLLRQSLVRSLECVRSQWHGALVLAIVLDETIDKFGGTEQYADVEIMARLSQLRYLYAKLLRDPLAIATDAAALAEVRRRAEITYELPKLMRGLRDKFSALTGLVNNQSVLRNLRYIDNGLNQTQKKQ